MFAERFDALMKIAEVSNSLLGRGVNMNPSHIGRLRSGARPLPKKHEYLSAMCHYLMEHIKKEYQLNALQKLTGIGGAALASPEHAARYLERWLLEQEQDASAAVGRLSSGVSRLPPKPVGFSAEDGAEEATQKVAAYLYGNAGKRRAVEQFFALILQEAKPQTLLLFSDENMAWLYEDAAFAARWAELFKKVILRGNRVKIIHTVSRDINEMMEAVTRWIPIYMTGMVEPYCYPRLRDGIFRRTMFLAPNTAAVVSSSVQQDTEGMLNLFLTDRTALNALKTEYERYFALCRPLMYRYTERDADMVQKAAEGMTEAEGNAFFCSPMPPLFAMPEELVRELTEQSGKHEILEQWRRGLAAFQRMIPRQRLTLVLLEPRCALNAPTALRPSMGLLLSGSDLPYTGEQYGMHLEHLRQMERQYENLKLCFVSELAGDTLLYIKEEAGVLLINAGVPQTAFVIRERNLINAFWDYMGNCVLT